VSYNTIHDSFPTDYARCVGAGYIPSWADRKQASQDLSGAPKNCYLQSSADGIGQNDREGQGIEIVALCLEGMCNNAGGT
jgi:hypothetical protein